jgi:YidC/Oxa1 family membrane protein insertase
MDMKRTVIGVVLAMAFFIGWYMLVDYVNTTWPPTEAPQAAAAAAAPEPAATQPGGGGIGATSQPAGTPAPAVPSMAAQSTLTGLQLLDYTPGVQYTATLGSAARKDPTYALQLVTSPVGAGVDSVVLNDFLASVDDPEKKPYTYQQTDPAVRAAFGPALGTRSVTVNGSKLDVAGAVWRVESTGPAHVTYSLTFGTAGRPLLKLWKTYTVFDRKGAEHGGLGYEVVVDYDFENLAGSPLTVSLGYNGPALPPRELDAGPDRRIMAGYRNPNAAGILVESHYVETFREEHAVRELTVNEDKLVAYWVGASSVYFDAILMPPVMPHAPGQPVTSSSRSIQGHGLSPEQNEKQPVALTVETVDLTVNPQGFNLPLHVYFGPKARKVLNEPFYSTLPRHYDQGLVVRSGPCSYCTFDWLIGVLVIMLGAFQWVWGGFAGAGDWGLAIISLVVLVRLLLHPITKRSQISMLKMGKMGPEMERLRKKYADNKEELQKAMWEFQKQQGFTPILGCLPMFLQMPIWIALWSALNTTFELRHSAFLWGFTWIDDLAKPDRLIPFSADFAFRIPLINVHVDALNILPLLLAVVFYLQQKYTPKPPAMTPEQQQQQKMMQWMVLIFPIFLYGQPSGLNLYILASTGIGIWESKRIRKHIKEKEEAEKAGIVIVDAPPPDRSDRTTGGGGGGGGGGKGGKGNKGRGPKQPEKPSPGGWLARKLAELQEKAEQVRRENERRGGRDRA